MTYYKQVAEIVPVSGSSKCPFNCIGCEHLRDIKFWNKSDIDIVCDLEKD